ncbi:hypothetical protein TNCV_4759321 [Trichonephila clavipes]|nr:hypothetical protein TNCV_4759321 [Trichonephila clavipes]
MNSSASKLVDFPYIANEDLSRGASLLSTKSRIFCFLRKNNNHAISFGMSKNGGFGSKTNELSGGMCAVGDLTLDTRPLC